MGDEGRGRSRERTRRGDRGSRFSEGSRERDRSPDRRDRGSMKSSNNRVYVSNIPYEYRWQDLKDLFRNQVGDVQFVELFVDDNDKSKGCGIVEFADSSSVKKCLEVMQRFEVKGRKLVVKDDSGTVRDKHGSVTGGGKRSRDDRFRDDRRDHGNSMSMHQDDSSNKWSNTYGLSPQFLESLNIEPPLNNRVFVANLDYSITKKKLKEIFRLAGRVINVDMPLDKDGRSRGFAVIEYDHPVEAVQAISMLHNQMYCDRTLAVRMDRVNDTIKLPEGLKGIGMGLGQNGEPLKNVAHNLPSSNQSVQNGGAPGLLGAVPNNALQAAAALTGLGGVSALGNLNTTMLQAANLGGLASNLLQNGLGNADLSSLVNTSSLMQNQSQQQQLAALAASNSAGVGQNASGMSGYGRSDGSYSATQPVTYPQPQSYGVGRAYSGNDRSSFTSGAGADKTFSRKVLVSNIPPTANYKMLEEKFNEFGDVSYCEEKAPGSFLVVYASEWQAERAIRNLDKARVDGRYIEAKAF